MTVYWLCDEKKELSMDVGFFHSSHFQSKVIEHCKMEDYTIFFTFYRYVTINIIQPKF